jgi:hypothetical protein
MKPHRDDVIEIIAGVIVLALLAFAAGVITWGQ